MSTYSISGNTTVGLAVVAWVASPSGTPSGTVTCDALGNYTINGLNNGNYFLSVSNAFVVPSSQEVVVSGANVTGVDFARASVAWVIDSVESIDHTTGMGYIRFNSDSLTPFSLREWRGGSAGFTFQITSVSVSGPTVTYTGTITGGDSNALVGAQLSGYGFENAGNNVTFTITGSSATTLTCNVTTQSNETIDAAVTNSFPAVGMNVLFNWSQFI